MECVGLVAYVGGGDGTYRVLVWKSEGKRQLGRPKHSWEDNIKVYINEVCWEDVNWIYLAQDRANGRGSCEHGNEPLDSIKCREFLDYLLNYKLFKKDSVSCSQSMI